jgi:hypothetical protein
MAVALRQHLQRLARGDKVPMILIARFTDVQFAAINAGRVALDLHLLEQNEIVFIGRHLHTSRARDGYHIDDIVRQIESALCEEAVAEIQTHVSCMQNQFRPTCPVCKTRTHGTTDMGTKFLIEPFLK